MKTTLFFKRIDFYLQLAALVIPLLSGDYIGCYILLGISQPVSCLINMLLLDKFMKHSGRRVYEIGLGLLALSALLLTIINFDPGGWAFYAVAGVSALLAILYLYVSYGEMRLVAMQVHRKQYL